jgi:glycosyltransferase involved in cell wall biosynthesis
MDAATARRELGLPEDGQYIGTVSSLVAYEGLDDLIDAFALLASNHQDLILLIVGDGVSKPALQAQARLSGFNERIIFTGRVPRELAARYHQSLDVFVVPRKDLKVTRSVTPLKPVEALASSRPVVASRLPALEEIVDEGVSGLFAMAESPEQLAAAVERILGDVPLQRSMGDAGRAEVLLTRTWSANANALGRAYGRLSGWNDLYTTRRTSTCLQIPQ